jgi:hypothetical protein
MEVTGMTIIRHHLFAGPRFPLFEGIAKISIGAALFVCALAVCLILAL